MEQQFTKYEIARIIGARALQIAMDAPMLMKISEEELKAMRYNSLKIAEMEFKEGVLPISINRPVPQKRKDKLTAIKEEAVSDAEIVLRKSIYPEFYAAGWFVSNRPVEAGAGSELVVVAHGDSIEEAQREVMRAVEKANWNYLARDI